MSQRKPTHLVPADLNLVSSASGLQDRLAAQSQNASGRAGYAVVDLADGGINEE